MRTVRSSFAFMAFRMRITSIITALPAPLSVAPVPLCHESRCAPTITISSAFDPPGISPVTLYVSALAAEISACKFSRTRTGIFFSVSRAMRLYCSRLTTKVGGASVSLASYGPAPCAKIRPLTELPEVLRIPATPSS